ncbi:hypothetical protein ON010_g1612 [Phytophthora cinnamomi]|nr:hypothetical protein ON010_g1612 [Phytophthora cinnamomi]
MAEQRLVASTACKGDRQSASAPSSSQLPPRIFHDRRQPSTSASFPHASHLKKISVQYNMHFDAVVVKIPTETVRHARLVLSDEYTLARKFRVETSRYSIGIAPTRTPTVRALFQPRPSTTSLCQSSRIMGSRRSSKGSKTTAPPAAQQHRHHHEEDDDDLLVTKGASKPARASPSSSPADAALEQFRGKKFKFKMGDTTFRSHKL